MPIGESKSAALHPTTRRGGGRPQTDAVWGKIEPSRNPINYRASQILKQHAD
jgi:hypothetical protein